jgi:transcriptional regulator with XRE-family HTH domain
MKISEKILYLRKAHNMSQDKLATSLNVSRQAISKWESGQNYPDLENIKLLSRLFDKSIDELVHDELSIDDSESKEKSNDLIYVVVGMAVGLALSFITGNYMLSAAGGLLGLAYAFVKK